MQLGISKLSTPLPKTTGYQNSIFEIVLLVIVVGLFYYFLIMPKQAEVASYTGTIKTLEEQKKSYTLDNSTLETLTNDLKKNKDNFEKLDQALPTNSKVTSVYILLEDISKDNDIIFSNVTVSAKPDSIAAANKALEGNQFKGTKTLGNMTIAFTVNAKFPNFVAFLKNLENSGRIINVKSIDVSSSQEDRLVFQVTANIYYYE